MDCCQKRSIEKLNYLLARDKYEKNEIDMVQLQEAKDKLIEADKNYSKEQYELNSGLPGDVQMILNTLAVQRKAEMEEYQNPDEE